MFGRGYFAEIDAMKRKTILIRRLTRMGIGIPKEIKGPYISRPEEL